MNGLGIGLEAYTQSGADGGFGQSMAMGGDNPFKT